MSLPFTGATRVIAAHSMGRAIHTGVPMLAAQLELILEFMEIR